MVDVESVLISSLPSAHGRGFPVENRFKVFLYPEKKSLERLCRRLGTFVWIRLEKSGKKFWRILEKSGENWRTRIVWISLEKSKNILEKTREFWRRLENSDKTGKYSRKI
ncbi:hypothetical protein Phum_PHUM069600 [Pediculus humanus corporis]|uniref:Uncharacterized protein n=1 Tax=Pediculus humanus subsp. corporis TaxID=121224 RepID=E0VBT3_PEDHC|nr:uncharacterized protein Phum_PHUM069600 [Pediculus humanus corporis]EEB10839.1 hypothetical protein Phum_PHUM069600 [Pediculus humanus corporis]